MRPPEEKNKSMVEIKRLKTWARKRRKRPKKARELKTGGGRNLRAVVRHICGGDLKKAVLWFKGGTVLHRVDDWGTQEGVRNSQGEV